MRAVMRAFYILQAHTYLSSIRGGNLLDERIPSREEQ